MTAEPRSFRTARSAPRFGSAESRRSIHSRSGRARSGSAGRQHGLRSSKPVLPSESRGVPRWADRRNFEPCSGPRHGSRRCSRPGRVQLQLARGGILPECTASTEVEATAPSPRLRVERDVLATTLIVLHLVGVVGIVFVFFVSKHDEAGGCPDLPCERHQPPLPPGKVLTVLPVEQHL